ncbi:Chalcone-flavanone isomerase family protein [Theobroma cacao]|uniref:Chalcone-flavanone isomerase family protein n=1 Tax=Theobroma cacao TaxID=3641 RepID=A0A061EDM6_THECC|nr:Chalcone-flavanone isomerase family protein [Theobroma cacao]
MMVRLVIVFSCLTMSMVRKNFDEGLGASIKKLTGGKKNDELANKFMGQASDDIKLTPGSLIEISRLPGYVLQTKVMGEVVSKVESELLCRSYINMYLGDDALDKGAQEKFGMSLLSLFQILGLGNKVQVFHCG